MKNEIHHADWAALTATMPSECVDLIVTDPPYLMGYRTNRRKGKEHAFSKAIAGDDFDSDRGMISDYMAECHRILKQDSAMYIFCNSNRVDFFKQELEKHFSIKNLIVWVKNNHTAGDLDAAFGKKYEFIFLVNKGRKRFSGTRLTDVWLFDRVNGGGAVASKPKASRPNRAMHIKALCPW